MEVLTFIAEYFTEENIVIDDSNVFNNQREVGPDAVALPMTSSIRRPFIVVEFVNDESIGMGEYGSSAPRDSQGSQTVCLTWQLSQGSFLQRRFWVGAHILLLTYQ